MTYAKVINGEIVENNRTLPFSNETTSFGVGSTHTDMSAHNYYPVIGTEPEYDRSTHRSNGVTYSFDGTQINKIYDIQPISLDALKAAKIQTIKDTNTARDPVLINGVTYHGGDFSAIAIKAAIDLALSKNEPSVKIWDVNDLTQVYTFAEANHIMVTIADEYQTKQFTTKDRITSVNAIVIDPQGTYKDYASAKAALDLI